jgi:hypothetical protein
MFAYDFPASKPKLLSAADALIQHLALTRKLHAGVQDLYSRPIAVPVLALTVNDQRSRRPSRPAMPETERDAA